MPWFPDFVSAAELVRKQTRAASQTDPVGQYLTALNGGDAHLLETAWPGHLVVYDPRRARSPATISYGTSSATTRPGWPSTRPGSRP